jgi:GTP-binding protein LepA
VTKKLVFCMTPPHLIRNFSIVAHIDHGKTTLTDRLLLKTSTITQRLFSERMMDSNPIEQERGITIKMAPVRMMYRAEDGVEYQLNLIDTPGHVDFSYEVSRSLAAVEGVLLLVDVTQGIQAQTLAHYQKAMEHGLTILPVLNKVDLAGGDAEAVMLEMMDMLGFGEDEFVLVSAKTGHNVEQLLEAIVARVPPPKNTVDKPLKALVFNSIFNTHKGVITHIKVVDGVLKEKDQILFMASAMVSEVNECGIFSPSMKPIDRLTAGEVGYVVTGFKSIRVAQVGDTITLEHNPTSQALAGYQAPQLLVFMDLYPIDGDDFELLKESLDKLILNDSALSYIATHSYALGNGFRVGFLGILHAEIVQERLRREFGLDLIGTTPSVSYQVEMTDKSVVMIHNPVDLPDPSSMKQLLEPMIKATVFTPRNYLGPVIQLLESHRASQDMVEYFGDRVKLDYTMPLSELIIRFVDELKSVSSGYASLQYELADYQPVDAVKLSILVNHELVEALSMIVVKDQADRIGREVVARLKTVIPRQLFAIPIQAAVGGRVVARETVKPFRKDVTAKLYGGDVTRRKKLLEKQKEGKKKRRQFGSVEIPQEAFFVMMKKSN